MLAEMYREGKSGLKDDIEGDKWFILAGKSAYANKWLILDRKRIELGMSKEGMADAQRRADAWKPTPESKSQ